MLFRDLKQSYGTSSFKDSILPLILSKHSASSKLQIQCGREYPHIAFCRVFHYPANTPLGNIPVGVRPLSVSTLSLSSLRTEKTLAILPIAQLLFLMISFWAAAEPSSWSSPSVISSLSEQILRTFTNISVTFPPINGKDCQIFVTLFSYFSTAPLLLETSKLLGV